MKKYQDHAVHHLFYVVELVKWMDDAAAAVVKADRAFLPFLSRDYPWSQGRRERHPNHPPKVRASLSFVMEVRTSPDVLLLSLRTLDRGPGVLSEDDADWHSLVGRPLPPTLGRQDHDEEFHLQRTAE